MRRARRITCTVAAAAVVLVGTGTAVASRSGTTPSVAAPTTAATAAALPNDERRQAARLRAQLAAYERQSRELRAQIAATRVAITRARRPAALGVVRATPDIVRSELVDE